MLSTPLGKDRLTLRRFQGSESLSGLFEFTVDAVSTEGNLDFDAAIGKNCDVSLRSCEGVARHFNGVLVQSDWLGSDSGNHAYRLRLRPWLWLLGRQTNCRIFKDKTVLDIVKDVFATAGFNDYEVKASGDYDKIEYAVQYRETDLAFASRLMEEWGLYTFHLHSESKHQLVIADSRSCHTPVAAGGGRLPFRPVSGGYWRDREHLRDWRSERSFRTGKVELNDYDFKRPSAKLVKDASGSERYEKSTLERYDYPGRYVDEGRGAKFSRVRLEAEQAADRRRYASGEAPSLYPGGLFTLAEHGPDDGQYLVVEAHHAFGDQSYRTGSETGGAYEGHFAFQPIDRPFRAPLTTPRPLVHGPQTALVVTSKGKEGEEIDVDEHGRIFVQFHWNRDKERYSLPVRVAQSWSGPQWGLQVIPRVGQEVVVEFLEGDPDKPLVVGALYNGDNKFPYGLPDNKTQSGVKSNSSKGGGGYNELMFEDKKGEELVRVHAQKDMKSVILETETRTVGEKAGSGTTRSTTVANGDDKLEVATGNWDVDVAQKIHIKANVEIVLEVGASKITMTPGSIKVESGMIEIDGQAQIKQQAAMILIN